MGDDISVLWFITGTRQVPGAVEEETYLTDGTPTAVRDMQDAYIEEVNDEEVPPWPMPRPPGIPPMTHACCTGAGCPDSAADGAH